MTKTTIAAPECPRCRSPIPPSAQAGLCPACLMSQALVSDDSPSFDDETLSWGSKAPLGEAPVDKGWPQELGEYRLLRPLGRGGMGRVYEAQHRTTGRRLALKRLGRRLDSHDMRQRFLREGRLAASVSHPNSLYVFGSEAIEGNPVITMEIAECGTLQDTLNERGKLPTQEGVDAILDVIAGLEAAHEVGVLHRDVKPSNCFISHDGTVKVGDYGLSISTLGHEDSLATASGLVMGTPAFAAPEQLRGDDPDLRADIYSVGATLFALLTGRAPFEGKNAVHIVANAMNLAPARLSDLRSDIPADLARVVARTLAKEPGDRFESYSMLRDALLPFSSRISEPAPLKIRSTAGWVDFLIAFFVPYVALMLIAGAPAFHFGGFMERSLFGARHYLTFLTLGILYFTLVEGLWGAGPGKRRKGLVVVTQDGGRPGLIRAMARILCLVFTIEVIRWPLLLLTVSASRIEEDPGQQTLLYTAITMGAPWVAALSTLIAKRSNGFATPWDLASGTRVIFKPIARERPALEEHGSPQIVPSETVQSERIQTGRIQTGRAQTGRASTEPTQIGPYRIDGEIEGRRWLAATDPLLRRSVWLLRSDDQEPSAARKAVARPGRPRWLQKVELDGEIWHAYEASRGIPFSRVRGQAVPWSTLRHWLHDLASELWAAEGDNSLPAKLSLGHIWLTSQGRALLLDRPWPGDAEEESFQVQNLEGQQRFLNAIADLVDRTRLPLHARPPLKNLAEQRFEKASFLAGTLQGLLDRPTELSRWVRVGALFMLPTYSLVMTIVGSNANLGPLQASVQESFGSFFFFVTLLIMACSALVQLVLVPAQTSTAHSLFRLAVVDDRGRPATRLRLLARWAIAWLPLVAFLAIAATFPQGLASLSPRIVLGLWLGAALVPALWEPHRGLHDRLAGTWVIRR